MRSPPFISSILADTINRVGAMVPGLLRDLTADTDSLVNDIERIGLVLVRRALSG